MAKSKEIIAPLTGIKFILCALVILSNMMLYGDVGPKFAQYFNELKFAPFVTVTFRVDIFFMITGFLLMHLYADRFAAGITLKKVKDFLVVRLARVYPLYAMVLLLIVGLYMLGVWQYVDIQEGFEGSSYRVVEPWAWLANFTLTTSWGVLENKSAWNGPAWSISAEFFNYLMFPFYLFFITRLKSTYIQLISIVVICAFYGVVQHFYVKDFMIDHGYGALARANFGLLSGAFVYGLYQHFKQTKGLKWDAMFMGVLILLGVMMSLDAYGIYGVPKMAYMVCLIFMVLCLSLMSGPVHNFFAHPFLMHLGKLSFAMYLLHQPVARVMIYFFKDEYDSVPADNFEVMTVHLLLIFVAIMVASHIAYAWVETPLRYKIRTKLGVKKVQVKI
ncbi:MAG: acyltransferase [Pseudomonadota bacterium]|nr:acyltransferase [Pseudomonadota bacterium]